jgi:4-hydroxy-2-oxoheptanedioate aldolase
MNNREFKCVSILTDMVENHGLIGIKTSFEDEGATFNEVLRLKEICNQAKTKLTLKIGGPEAIRDIQDSSVIGVKGLVAPMVESDFGLKKFINSVKNNLSEDVVDSLELIVNIETIQAYRNIDNILDTLEAGSLYAVTVGRVDFVSSMGKDRSYVNSPEMLQMTKEVFTKAKSRGLTVNLGGAVTADSLKFLNELYKEGLLDKFETRYAIYDPSKALKNLNKALAKGQLFEYEWLVAKREAYQSQADKDLKRIQMIQDRINQSTNI